LLSTPVDKKTTYFIQLAIFHQDMHNQVFAYIWQTLGYPMPFPPLSSVGSVKGDTQTWIHFPKPTVNTGSDRHSGFIFDHEKWDHSLELPAFEIASKPVTHADYVEFLKSKGNFSDIKPVMPPSHWKKDEGFWFERFFNTWLALNPASAVRHISYLDAQGFCDINQARLPNEHELSLLMSQKQTAWQSSHLLEWTNSSFAPFPGFSSDPYVDYSQS
jgi:hypothetical protein